MIDINSFLAKLQKAHPAGKSEWTACCPAHKDTNQSLRIHLGADGEIWVKCFAGCNQEDVLSAMGLTWADVKPPRPRANKAYGMTIDDYAVAKHLSPEFLRREAHLENAPYRFKSGSTCPAVKMPYFGLDGKQTALRWRLCLAKNQGKDGRDTRFKWEEGSQGHLTLYGLWRLANRLPLEQLILVEGESDCHTLWQGGFDALGLPGAGTYSVAGDTELLKQCGRVTVIIEPDKGGKTMYQKLAPLAKEGVDVRFATLGEAKDTSSAWCNAPSQEEFRKAINTAIENAKAPADFIPPEEWIEVETKADTSRANGPKGALHGVKGGRPEADYISAVRAFANTWMATDGFHLRHYREQWYEWFGGKWQAMPDTEMASRTMAWLQNAPEAVACNIKPTQSALRNLLEGIRSMNYAGTPFRYKVPSWLPNGESAQGWLPTASGLIEIEATAYALENCAPLPPVHPLTPALLCTYCLPYGYDPNATCPTYDQYLLTCIPDEDTRDCWDMWMGLMLVPDTSLNVCAFLVGPGGTGKTTALNTMTKMVGDENTCACPILSLAEKFDTWPLGERLVNIVEDLPVGDPLHKMAYVEGIFKASVGGGMIKTQHKYKDSVDMPCIARHVFATNSLPHFFDKSDAIWDRLRIFPFETRFRGTAAEIPDMELRLQAELPGILNRSLRGLARLRACGGRFPESKLMADRKAAHRAICDPDLEYFQENYTLSPDSWVEQSAAYEHYCKYLEQNGYSRRSSSTFLDSILRRFGIRPTRLSQFDRRRVLKGLRLDNFTQTSTTINF